MAAKRKTIALWREPYEDAEWGGADWVGDGEVLVCDERLQHYFVVPDKATNLYLTLHQKRVPDSVKVTFEACSLPECAGDHRVIEVEGNGEVLEENFEQLLWALGLDEGKPLWITVEYE